MKASSRRLLLLATVTLLSLCLLTQLQPLLLRALGAVDGSFGLRRTSHACLGLSLPAPVVEHLPAGEIEMHLGAFHIRYSLAGDRADQRPACLGQDIWYGE